MGTSYTALSGSRGMVASLSPQSSAGKPHESTLPGLDEGTREGTPLNVDLRRGLAVDLDPALGDQSPGLARRADAEVLDQEGREVDQIAGRQLHLGDLFRRPLVADDTREVILAPRRAFLPCHRETILRASSSFHCIGSSGCGPPPASISHHC